MSNIIWYQPLKCKDLLLFFVMVVDLLMVNKDLKTSLWKL